MLGEPNAENLLDVGADSKYKLPPKPRNCALPSRSTGVVREPEVSRGYVCGIGPDAQGMSNIPFKKLSSDPALRSPVVPAPRG